MSVSFCSFPLFADSQVFAFTFQGNDCKLIDFMQKRYFPFLSTQEVMPIIQDRIKLDGKKVTTDKEIVYHKQRIEYTHYRSDEKKIQIATSILYEDEHLLALYKPPHVPVIPSGKFFYTSMAIWAKEAFANVELTPLHRIDLETSGVLLFGKTKKARSVYQTKFQKQEIHKLYYAITTNKPKQDHIAGDLVPDTDSKIFTKYKLIPTEKPTSRTYINEIASLGKFFHLKLTPITGKLNQIRIHLASLGCSIVGDKKYYPDENLFLSWIANRNKQDLLAKVILSRQALHCQSLAFHHILANKDVCIQDTTTHWQNLCSYIINL